MVLIRFEFNNKIISEKMVSIAKYDKHNITTIIDFFKDNFNLDIGKYRLSEYYVSPGIFTLKIRSKDLVKLRDDKLKSLGL